MSSIIWNSIHKVRELSAGGAYAVNAPKVERLLNSVMETIADTLPSASLELLTEGAEAATDALNTLRVSENVDRQSPAFAAGRLASAIDVLGYAAAVTADQAAITRARQHPYVTILQQLFDAPLRNVDLVRKLSLEKSQASRYLADLREMEMVTSHQRGREVFNNLTPAGRLVVEERIQSRNRVAIVESNVHSFRLADRVGPADAEPSFPALIRAS
jgi:DNA-binding transcriptional ArsR family regulator